jgi:hypothetical protein
MSLEWLVPASTYGVLGAFHTSPRRELGSCTFCERRCADRGWWRSEGRKHGLHRVNRHTTFNRNAPARSAYRGSFPCGTSAAEGCWNVGTRPNRPGLRPAPLRSAVLIPSHHLRSCPMRDFNRRGPRGRSPPPSFQGLPGSSRLPSTSGWRGCRRNPGGGNRCRRSRASGTALGGPHPCRRAR